MLMKLRVGFTDIVKVFPGVHHDALNRLGQFVGQFGGCSTISSFDPKGVSGGTCTANVSSHVTVLDVIDDWKKIAYDLV
mgnify:CR=1 FL=1